MASRFAFSKMKGQMMRAATDEATNAVSHVLGIGSLGLFSHTINPVNLRHLPHVPMGPFSTCCASRPFFHGDEGDLAYQGGEPPHQRRGNQREDDAGKQHPLQVEPLLMVGLVHMLGPLKPKQGQIGEQDPVEKAGVV